LTQLISVDEAQQILLAGFSPVGTEFIPLDQVFGRVLADNISASLEMPPFDNSSMDGFALRAADVHSASPEKPVGLEVVGDIPAGVQPRFELNPGQAARIVTGAVVPAGADAVVPIEDTRLGRSEPGSVAPPQVQVCRPVKPGDSIRPRGQDIHRGDLLITKGRRLQPQDMGVLAMQGIAAVKVYRRPKIGLLSSGDELLPVGVPLEPGKIYETNSYTLNALITQNGCGCLPVGTSQDSFAAVQGLFDRTVDRGVDLILSSAGVSMGAFDYVRAVIEKNGTLKLWRVNLRPGKPLTFGNYKGVSVIGLPGNPVSAFVGFKVFVEPVLAKLRGMKPRPPQTQTVQLADPIDSDGRESYLRAIVSRQEGAWVARLTGHQGSGNLLSLVQANALIIIPAAVKSMPVGAEVQAWFLNG